MSLAVRSVVTSAVAVAVLLSGCREASDPLRPTPAEIEIVANPAATATVGSEAGTVTVHVRDAEGNSISGVVVSFTVSLGGGNVEPMTATTTPDGSASTTLTIGTVPGPNQVTATVEALTPVRSVSVVGLAGPNAVITITPRTLRFPVVRAAEFIAGVARDGFGNRTGSAVSWTSRNPGLVTVTPGTGGSVNVQVVSRPGQAYIVGSAGGATDSILVSVLDANSTPCTYAAAPTTLAIGESLPFESMGVACIRSDAANAEYALIAHYSAAAGNAFATVEVTPTGVFSLAQESSPAHVRPGVGDPIVTDDAFELGLRQRERQELGARAAGARSWYGSRPLSFSQSLQEGDIATANVNAFDFCSNAEPRGVRVAAITSTAVILADTSNPAGGFTDEEYRAFGRMMDTLVHPLSIAAFGEPTDVDGNGRVAILFTGAVNEITPRGTPSGVVLGFFYSRDLLPKQGAAGICPGSNVSEMFYVLVPDTGGVLSDRRSKSFVESLVVGTIVHEYQHLINTSRRLYVTRSPSPIEEVWLNEGLSHVAEELLFYNVSALTPRQNLGAAALQDGSAARNAFDTYARSNFARYSQYLRSPDLHSPISTEDFVATRGAAWSFLRYLADHAGSSDGDLWFRIANGQLTGIANLDQALTGAGRTTLGLLADWSMSVLADDHVPQSPASFQQPSWDFVNGMPAVGLAHDLAPLALTSGLLNAAALRAGGSSYMAFGVAQNQEALVRVTGASGNPYPAGVRLTLVRTR